MSVLAAALFSRIKCLSSSMAGADFQSSGSHHSWHSLRFQAPTAAECKLHGTFLLGRTRMPGCAAEAASGLPRKSGLFEGFKVETELGSNAFYVKMALSRHTHASQVCYESIAVSESSSC